MIKSTIRKIMDDVQTISYAQLEIGLKNIVRYHLIYLIHLIKRRCT